MSIGADELRLRGAAGVVARRRIPWKSPLDLVAFYQSRGAEYFADVCPDDASSTRKALHAAIASRYNVVVDRPGIFLARLTKPDP